MGEGGDMRHVDLRGQYDHLYIIGDVHAEFEQMMFVLQDNDVHDAVVIVAGDCGFGFHSFDYYEELYVQIERRLRVMNVMLLMVRGNHDDPNYFNGNHSIDYPLLKTLPDYTVVSVLHHHILCIGGAISVDRKFRLAQMHRQEEQGLEVKTVYWQDEGMEYSEEEMSFLECSGLEIDFVVTHTSPMFFPMRHSAVVERLVRHDPQLRPDIVRERDMLVDVYKTLRKQGHPLKYWAFGHYHYSQTFVYEGMRMCMLDVMELKEYE